MSGITALLADSDGPKSVRPRVTRPESCVDRIEVQHYRGREAVARASGDEATKRMLALTGTVLWAVVVAPAVSDRSIVDLIEDWQTGFFVVVGSAVVGILVGLVGRSVAGPPGFVLGIPVGAILGFLAYSYLRYGR